MMIFSPKLIFRSIVLICFFTACKNKKVENKANLTETARQIITEHFRLLNAHDLKGLVDQYESKARITTTDWDGVSFGPAGADQIFHQIFYISPDAKYLTDNMIVNDSTVVVEYDVVGLKEKNNGIIRHDMRYCSVFKIKDNRIVNESTYANSRLYHNQ